MKLKLAADLRLPVEAVTETFGILAARGAGKSNLAAVLAEQMFAAGLPFVVVDPVGAWFGLRAGADGTKGGGLPIPIFGGRHGDVPLERGSGELVADLVVGKRLSCVLDLSGFESEAAKKGFLLDFARRLYLKNEDPLHLFLEEADDYIPQRPMRDEAQLLRAWENIVRRGRSRGLGMTLITQRSASLSKSVLTQVQTLFVLRTTGPHDRAAIEAWVKYHDADAKLLASLSSLGPGEGWVWSPQFLGQMTRHQFHRRRTFDSGATPKNLRGKDAKKAATLADVDLDAVQADMAATIERAKADDPRELRKQLADKDRRITQLEKGTSGSSLSNENAKQEVPLLTDADRALLTQLGQEFATFSEDIGAKADVMLNSLAARAKAAIDDALKAWTDHIDRRRDLFVGRLEKARVQRLFAKIEQVALTPSGIPGRRESTETTRKGPAAGLTGAARQPRSSASAGPDANGRRPVEVRILSALAELEQLGARTPARPLVAMLAGYSHLQSKGFVNALSSLRTSGAVDYPSGGNVALTEHGRAQARYPAKPRTPQEVQERVIGLLGGASGRILRPLIHAYPSALSRATVAAAAGYGHLQSKGFVNAVSRLRTLGFIDYPARGSIRAQPVLFLVGQGAA